MGLFKSNRVVYKPVKDVNLGPDSTEFYLQANVKAPRMTGIVVKIVTWLLESRIFGAILLYILKGNNLIHKHVTNADLEEPPLYVPLHHFEDHKEQEVKSLDFDLTPQEKVQVAINCLPITLDKPINGTKPSLNRWTIMDYFNAYSSGIITPNMVAERFIAAVDESSKPRLQMGFFINYNVEDILKQASESTIRYQKGEPISVLDGVPVAIKDEIDCLPYPTTGGTKWLHKQRPCTDDASCITRLRSCGAMLVGKTNMHELGAGTSGINPHYGASRNPYDASRIAGGSSSGSAAVVSAGLCPVALGVDGGGSVRMPAALCGVVGLKPTFGRIPHAGVLPLNWTVGMVGILAGTVEDSLITYAAISGEIPSPQPSSMPAKINLPMLPLTKSISNIKLAKYDKWFDDCSDDVRTCCSHALKKLQGRYGWKIVDVTIPEIEVMRLAHYSTIGSECHTSLDSFQDKNLAEFGWDARVALKIYGAFSSMEYIKAQKIRNRQLKFHKKIFSEADVIVSPTTGVTAYPIQSDALKTGELDYVNGAALIRYSIAGNFLGLPAVTVPVGYDKSGLPIGLQFIGRPWAEATLIHLAFAMQAICLSEYRKPAIYYDLLRKNK
ncbi:fatty acid amide hydrolase [Trifolium repens]|nr:fatty acid amide hydrolase [Trifolium repens]